MGLWLWWNRRGRGRFVLVEWFTRYLMVLWDRWELGVEGLGMGMGMA